MPLYTFHCPEGHRFTRFLRLADYDLAQSCDCGKAAERIITAPAIQTDYAGYTCPVTGDWIEGRRAHKENLAKHGCRVLETGEREQFAQRKREEDAAFEEQVAETAAAVAANMPSHKKELLGKALDSGLDVGYSRA